MTLDVDGLRFTFTADWRVVKWDETDAYRAGIHRQGETKAVDLLARSASGLAIIEVKDFRHDPKTDWRRVKDRSLATEAAAKVRGTLAGLLGGAGAMVRPGTSGSTRSGAKSRCTSWSGSRGRRTSIRMHAARRNCSTFDNSSRTSYRG